MLLCMTQTFSRPVEKDFSQETIFVTMQNFSQQETTTIHVLLIG